MKKFYNSPVVEITVFDVEDVITTSAISTKQFVDAEGNVTADFKAEAASVGVTTTAWDSTYAW